MVSAAAGRPLVEMGTRRTHEEAAVAAARAAYLAGFASTSNLAAGRVYDIPTVGTTPPPGPPTGPPGAPAPTIAPGVPAPASPIPTPEPLQQIGRLEIPAIGLTKYIVEGVSVRSLKQGPAHFAETPLPGQFGNSAIAGHRTTYGQPFWSINELAAGDEIIVTLATGNYTGTYYYLVREQRIIDPDDCKFT